MGALYEGFELLHAFGFVFCQIGIDIVIVRDGIGRAGAPFGDRGRVEPVGGVADNACVPNVRGTQIRDGLECTLVDIYKPSATVLFLGAVVFASLVVVRKQAREELVNNGFIDHIM